MAPAPTVAQTFSHNEGTQTRDAEPYIYIPMPSLPASPERPQREGPSNILDVAPGLRASLDRNAQRGRERGRNRVTRGTRRGRGRGRSRGRITVGRPCQGPGARLSRAEDPSAGWKTIPSCTAELMLERDYVNTYVSQGARLFCSAAMERLAVELDVKNLKRKQSHVFVLLCDELVGKCCEWLKGFSILRTKHERSITASNLYRYLAVMLFSQCTGCSFTKTLDMFEKLGGQRLDEEILNYINTNILAYAATGRGEDNSLVWNTQRDQTVMLGQFERDAFRMSARIFLAPNQTIISFDDDLMGTRAVDNQVKTISNRKADDEGHVTDVLAHALFRVVLQMRFRRRHDKLESCVSKIVANLMEVGRDISRQGMIVVADRGYARRHVLNALMDQGLSCFGVMPEFMLKCHPIVGKSYPKVASFIGGDSDEEDGNEDTDEVGQDRVVYDRPSEFVMEDGPTLGPGVKVAKARYKPQDRAME